MSRRMGGHESKIHCHRRTGLEVSQEKRSVKHASDLDITEAQRTKLLSVFKSARLNKMSAADVQKQMGSILTPTQQKTLMKYLNDGGGNSSDASGTRADTSKQGRRWTA